jgi:hypothetical protein
MGLDTRQIQTAVLGSAESDDPVVCPTDPAELDAFRSEYQGDSFWCGLLLGGCGGRLGTRRCLGRVCHFYHLPSPDGPPSTCGRHARESGAGSADHLYVKAATEGWLHRQGRAPRYRFAPPRSPRHEGQDMLGSLVDVEGAGVGLRFHMDSSVPPDWDTADVPEPILGPGVPIATAVLARRRYVNRFRFTSDGSRRVLRFGTQTLEGTDWFDPSQCTITPDGTLTTPTVERLRATTAHPAPVSGPPSPPATAAPAAAQRPAAGAATASGGQMPVQIGTLIRRLNTAVGTQNITEVRILLRQAEGQMGRCVGLALERLQAAVRAARTWLDKQDNLRRLIFTRLEEAVRARRPDQAQSLSVQARRLLERGEKPTSAEAALLAEAQRLARTAPAAWTPHPRQARRQYPTRKAAKQARRAAADDARRLLNRLHHQPGMPREQQQALIGELSRAVAAAGGELTPQEHHAAADWTYRTGNRQAGTPPPAGIGQFPPPRPLFLAPAAAPPDPPRTGQVQRGDDRRAAALEAAAAAVRGALKKAAREQTTTSWSRLRTQLGSALPRMNPAEQTQVLTLADRATPAGQPLLTALLAAGDPTMTGPYRAAAAGLGRPVPADDIELHAQLTADVRGLHDQWRHQ